MSREFLDIVSYGSVVLTVASTITYWSSPIKRLPQLKYIGIYLILLVITELSSKVLYHLRENNLPILHLYTLLELIFLSLFYRTIFSKNKQIITWVIIFSSVAIISNSIFIQSILGFNSNAKTLEQIVIIVYAILFFFNYPSLEITDKVLAKSLNLINSAILIYFSGSLFIFMFSSYFQNNGLTVNRGFWEFNAFLSLLFQLLVFISLWRIAFRKQT